MNQIGLDYGFTIGPDYGLAGSRAGNKPIDTAKEGVTAARVGKHPPPPSINQAGTGNSGRLATQVQARWGLCVCSQVASHHQGPCHHAFAAIVTCTS